MLQRRTLTSQVIDYVLDLIKSGKVTPGERLPTERQLTESLGVSRTCVREAIKSLESLRLIRVRPRLGAVVLEPSPAALFSAEHFSAAAHMQKTDVLLEFRSILEVGLASLAAQKATAEDLAAMRKAMRDHKQGIETTGIAYEADIAFHKAIAEAARNPFVTMVLEMISVPLMEQRRKTNAVPHAAADGLRDHVRIYKAIKAGDPDRARAAMRAHMNTAERYWTLAEAASQDQEQNEEIPLPPEDRIASGAAARR